jgi:hypothetical protein
MCGEVQIWKKIFAGAEDKVPKDERERSPLHFAAEN